VSLTRTAQAHAVLKERDFVLPDDVKEAAVGVLAHRVLPSGGGSTARSRDIVADVLGSVPAPIGELRPRA
jgi:MoxR-like ATPase